MAIPNKVDSKDECLLECKTPYPVEEECEFVPISVPAPGGGQQVVLVYRCEDTAWLCFGDGCQEPDSEDQPDDDGNTDGGDGGGDDGGVGGDTGAPPDDPPGKPSIDILHEQYLKIQAMKAFNDEYKRLSRILDLAANASYEADEWDLELLPNQRLADLQELGIVSGNVTAHTWLLGDTIEHDLAPALSGSVDFLRLADIAFGAMDMGYDDLRWVSDDVLEGLTVNAAAMSAGLTPWVAGISKEIEQRRLELEAYRPQPAPAARSDSPPGSGSSGGGLSWDEGLELYRRRSGETAENIEWMRTRPDDKAGSGPNTGSTFREIVRDAVKKSGEDALFAMGGIVPGAFGTPVPAVVHGGERIVGAGNGGGVPINLEVHVHGTVISEGDLARNVRDGLMRRFD